MSNYDNGNNHPELREGEVFLTNTSSEQFGQIGYKTKRLGDVAYDIYGKYVDNLQPVFVQRSELEECGIVIETLHKTSE